MLEKLAGSSFMDEWVGMAVQLYFDPTVKFGKERVGGIRIRQKKIQPTAASAPAPLICADCGQPVQACSINGQDWTAAKVAEAARKKYGQVLCWPCVTKRKEAEDHAPEVHAD